MKKFLFAVLGITLLFQCCTSQSDSGQRKEQKYIYITAFIEEEFFIEVKKGMTDAASLLGVNCVFTGTKDADIPALNGMIKKAIEEQYDGIALNIFSPGIYDDVIKEANAANIPVIAFNIDDPHSGRLAGVQQNFYSAGKRLGEKTLPHLQENDSILIALHDKGVSALDDRAKGIVEALKTKNVHIKYIITGNTPEIARKSIQAVLTTDIRAILCTGQSDTEGAGLAAKALSGSKPYIAGFDVSEGITQLIKEHIIDFSIDQQPYIQGFYPLLMM
ncbi:MAG: substrate-binding domain-containing protein, partial [Tannerella sp.]|nr:substrate-binding domain-containing protein [Tannerella sp.]